MQPFSALHHTRLAFSSYNSIVFNSGFNCSRATIRKHNVGVCLTNGVADDRNFVSRTILSINGFYTFILCTYLHAHIRLCSYFHTFFFIILYVYVKHTIRGYTLCAYDLQGYNGLSTHGDLSIIYEPGRI